MAGPVPGPQSGGQSGTFDVKPSDLYRVSQGIAAQQTPMDRGAKDLLDKLREYPDAGGYGTAPEAFAASYVKVGNLYLETWAKSVVSIGGAAVGFTSTANTYAKAEAANDPTGKTKALTQPLPKVIETPPNYGSVPHIKWGDDDGGDDFLRSLLEWVPEPVREVLRPVVKHAFRMGKVAEVYPYPQQHYLYALHQAWLGMTAPLSMAESALTGYVDSITQQSNSEWHTAMRQFCSSLWGTTAWGRSRQGYEWKHDSGSAQTSSHPVMAVLFDTAEKVGNLLRDFAEAAVYINGEVWEVYTDAIRDAVPKIEVDLKDGVGMDDLKGLVKGVAKSVVKGAAQLGAGIVLNIDTPRLNAIVNEYNRRVNALVPQMDALVGPLEEARRSAPKFEAQEARAEAFGRRALNEFRKEHQWTDPADAANGVYKVDLAASEWMNNGHTLDKHVGKTPEQLAQRLRDQGDPATASWPHGKPTVGAASTFADLPSAQKYTQHNIDQHSSEIKAWLEGPPPPAEGDVRKFVGPGPNGEVTGTSVTKQPYDPSDPTTGFKESGMAARPVDVKNVDTRLKYDSSLDPPFVVITSMPAR
ncbi:RNase A-like domain-containing protein [Streptomyces sp. CC77]|uniref:RNase A-like domain-containing protein n=1 Tax=Streptomyces sp. CC77 TaxID=1906739 RepID=UPI000AEB4C7E|nr:RNase A-like domain-containing protein [Streptomyces sp. CC77]